jgi:hypothetical protein
MKNKDTKNKYTDEIKEFNHEYVIPVKLNDKYGEIDNTIFWGNIKKFAINFVKPKEVVKKRFFVFLTEFVLALVLLVFLVMYVYFALYDFTNDMQINPILKNILIILVAIMLYAADVFNMSLIITYKTSISKYGRGRNILLALIFSGASIYLLTAGIQFKTQNSDKQYQTISINTTNDSLNIVTEYDTEIERYKTLIQDIKDNPAITGSGRVLSSKQLTQIENYNTLIVELRSEKQLKLSELETKRTELNTVASEKIDNKIFKKILIGLLMELALIFLTFEIVNYFVHIYLQDKAFNQTLEGRKVSEKYKDKITDELDEEFSEKFGEELTGKGGDENRTKITGSEPFDVTDWKLKN